MSGYPGDFPRGDSGAISSAAAVVTAVRRAGGASRVDVAELTGLSKAVVSERVRTLIDAGLLEEAGEGTSTGGRRATRLRMQSGIGVVMAVEIAMTHVRVSTVNLAGELMASETLDVSMHQGPDSVLRSLEEAIERQLEAVEHGAVCGIGVGVAGPVEFSTGRTVHPPVHPDWHDQPVRDRLAVRFGVPVWVDNEVNLMALAEQQLGAGAGSTDSLVVKIGSWVGAGLISNGRLHRGAQGSAGSLVTNAGGDDIARQAELLALSGQSAALTQAAEQGRPLTSQLVAELAQLGDQECRQLLDEAAENIGRVMSVVVDFFNPAIVVVAGGVTSGGDSFLARIRETVYGRSLALATRDLRIVRSELGPDAAILGAAIMAVDELTSAANLSETLTRLSGRAQLHQASSLSASSATGDAR